ncbi:uncharacterized protein N7515_000154 [Penicillium bovifimosum]|uniref:Retrotransposon gag domain-containing protein n=1 Tax=Penicillium bovifimosum TaxID=126998 RepID=A0A9W9HGR8_9EURO|nr:uncharacterized protein N7515_000154 [Penicillium bovifimosum]KAJ5145590.1 hypothetical protein N7515_000154 [Penicillium bovifimosum]
MVAAGILVEEQKDGRFLALVCVFLLWQGAAGEADTRATAAQAAAARAAAEEEARGQAAAAQAAQNTATQTPADPVATAAAALFRAMDNDTRRSLLDNLRAVPNYGGKIDNDAARKWIRDCDHYFADLKGLTGVPAPDGAKIIHATGKLVDDAAERLRAHARAANQSGQEPFADWDAFKRWLQREFSEHLSQEKLYERFANTTQGQHSIQEYAANLRQIIADLG